MEIRKYRAEAHVDDLIVLTYIIDDIDDFSEEYRRLATYSDRFVARDVDNCFDGKLPFTLDMIKIKNFCKRNITILEKINEQTYIFDFLKHNYYSDGVIDERFMNFCNYFKRNKKDMDTIRNVLMRLKDLDFEEVTYQPNTDYTDKVYETGNGSFGGCRFYYVDNAEVIPGYNSREIMYKTEDSPYEIVMGTHFSGGFSSYDKSINVNTLVFDPNRLPKDLEKGTLYEPLVSKKEAQKDTTARINAVTRTDAYVGDLNDIVVSTTRYIDQLDGITDKKELMSALKELKESVDYLRYVTNDCIRDIQKEDELVTDEVLEESKKQYTKQREADSSWCCCC